MGEKSVSIIETIDEVHPNQWNSLVSQADLGSVFHRYGWLKAVETGFGSEPRHIVVTKDSNPVAVLPNFYDSIYVPIAQGLVERAPVRELNSVTPGYGGPIVSGNEQECFEMLFGKVNELRDFQTVYHWIRTNKLGFIRYGQLLTDRGYTPITTSCRFRLDLGQSWEDIWNGLESDYRRRLRNTEDYDVEFRDEPITMETIREFYDEHARNLERIGTNPYSLSFYEELAEHLTDRLKVFTVVVEGQDQGQYLYLLDEERSTLHNYLAAIGDEVSFEFNASQLLHKHGIQWGMEHGYDYYDFGSTQANHTNGVFRHKEGYGGETVPSLYWRKGLSPVTWPAFVVAQKLLRRARAR